MASQVQSTLDLSGKVAVLTTLGADAVGEEIVAQLLMSNVARLYILAAAEEDFAAILDELSIRQDLSKESLSIEFVPCDLSSVRSSESAAKSLLQKLRELQRLDLLFCHASRPPSTSRSDQSGDLDSGAVDLGFATDYLGHYVLVNMLLPLIELTATRHQEARVVVSTSYLYTLVRSATLDVLTTKDNADHGAPSPSSTNAMTSYARSQLAKVLLTRHIAKVEHADKGYAVYCNCFDATDIQPDLLGASAASIPSAIFKKNRHGPEGAAATAIYLAGSAAIVTEDISGQYLDSSATPSQLDGAAEDKDLRNNLWYWSDHKVSGILGKGWAEGGKSMIDDAPAAAMQ